MNISDTCRYTKSSPHEEPGPEPVHVDVAGGQQLMGKLRGQRGVQLGREVAQRVLHGQLQDADTDRQGEQVEPQALWLRHWIQDPAYGFKFLFWQ